MGGSWALCVFCFCVMRKMWALACVIEFLQIQNVIIFYTLVLQWARHEFFFLVRIFRINQIMAFMKAPKNILFELNLPIVSFEHQTHVRTKKWQCVKLSIQWSKNLFFFRCVQFIRFMHLHTILMLNICKRITCKI